MWIRSAIPPVLSLSFTLLTGSTGYLHYFPVSSARGVLLPILMGSLFSHFASIAKLSKMKWMDRFPLPLITPLFFLIFHLPLLFFYPLCQHASHLPWSLFPSLRNAVVQITSMLIFCLLSPTKRRRARGKSVYRYLQWLKKKIEEIRKKIIEIKGCIRRYRKQVVMRLSNLDSSIKQLQRERDSLSHSWEQLHTAKKKWAQLLKKIQSDLCCSIDTIGQMTEIVKSDTMRGLFLERNAG